MMITNANQTSVSSVQKKTNEKVKATTQERGDNRARSDTMVSSRSTQKSTTEKVIAMAFPDMINAGSISSSSSSSSSSDNSSNSDCYSFESLFNGSTYGIDEYFNSIGFYGGSSISSSNYITNNSECLSTISALSGGDGDTFYDSMLDKRNMNVSKTSDDIESVYTSTSSSSSSSSTLNGLMIQNDASISHVVAPPSQRCSTGNTVTTVAAALDAMSRSSDKKTKSASSFGVKLLLLLEKIIVSLLLLAILTGCTLTILTIVRHVHSNGNKYHPTVDAASGIMTASNNQTTTTPAIGSNPDNDDERMFHIRLWLSQRYGTTNFDPKSGTPQYDALYWMAYVDVPSILGSDIQPRTPPTTNNTDEKNAVELWNSNISIRITQRFVLLLLFFNNIGTENLMLGGWASLTGARLTECIWPGITCRTLAGTANKTKLSVVTGLELNPWIAHLHGTIPTEIGLLSSLETLALTDNSLMGNFPSELYTLQKLHTLRISNTSVSTSLSPDMGNLTDMTFLDLSNNFICTTIPTELGLLTNLQYINLSRNNFTGTIPTELGQLHALENFFLEDNSFYGTMPSSICSLPPLHHLEELHADCVSPHYERIFCDHPKPRILCDCCTYCY